MVLHRLGEAREALTVESTQVGFDVTTVENSSAAHAERACGRRLSSATGRGPPDCQAGPDRVPAEQIDRTRYRRRAAFVGVARQSAGSTTGRAGRLSMA
jgi:hypothetical protein